MKTIEVDPRVPGNRDEFPFPQPSSALQELDSPSCQFKCPFSPKFTVLQEKLIVTNVRSVLSLCNTRFRPFHLLYDIRVMWRKTTKHAFSMFYYSDNRRFFDQSEHAQGPIYI